MPPTRVLITGWSSFLHGEATAGDLESMRRVAEWLSEAGIAYDIALSPVLRAADARNPSVDLDTLDPLAYAVLVFACGPLHGWQVEQLHGQFAHCRRLAVGVSVPHPDDPAVRGFDLVLPRDGTAAGPSVDLALLVAPAPPVPLIGVCLANPQPEYAAARHDDVHATLANWLTTAGLATVAVDTRIDPRHWWHPSQPAELDALLGRLDAVVTTRLHGLVLGLRAGVPVLAVDPVAGGAKVTAQATALGWSALLGAAEVDAPALDHWLQWCLSDAGRERARAAAATAASGATAAGRRFLDALLL